MTADVQNVKVPAGTRFVIHATVDADGRYLRGVGRVAEGSQAMFDYAENELLCLCIGIPMAREHNAHHGRNWSVKKLGANKYEVTTRVDC